MEKGDGPLPEVLYEKRDRVAIITINRPEARNAINKAVREGLREAWNRFESDPEAHVAILTGTGNQAFCAGADLKEMSQLGLRVPPRDFVPVLGRNVHVSKPVIAAVNGVALAGGWLLAQMCDLCVAAEHAQFGITEARWGRGAPWAIPLLWMIPQRVLMEILTTAEPISAQRAYEVGFVNRVVPLDRLMDTALQIAEKIAENAPLTVRAYKRMILQAMDIMGRAAALDAADAIFEPVYCSEDAQEGPRAFAERRKPVWKGR